MADRPSVRETGSGWTYRKDLGVIELVSLGLGGTIGSGIFIVPSIAASISGPASLIAWLIVAISALCVMASLAYAISRYPATGAFYAIFSRTFSGRISAGLVILYLVSSVFGIATIASGIGLYLTFLGIGGVLIGEIVVIALFCLLNLRGISLSSSVEILLTVLKVVPIIAIAALLIPHIRVDNILPLPVVAPVALLQTVIIVYWPFTGFEISAIPVEETRDSRMVARSLVIVMVLVTSMYLLLNISLIGSIGSGPLGASSAPVATAAGILFRRADMIVAIIGIIAMASALNAYIIGTSRVLHDLTRQFRVPVLSDLDARGVPVASLVASAIVSAVLLLFSNQFAVLASIAVLTTLVPYIFLCLAAFRLFEELRIRAIALLGAVTTSLILVVFLIL